MNEIDLQDLSYQVPLWIRITSTKTIYDADHYVTFADSSYLVAWSIGKEVDNKMVVPSCFVTL